mmetsp:Transcript_24231/g.71329  ORF Transcript_24231/g.71329 Transcript_24231/m.71329 type:complete len:238 (+) Transcript_24231:248-961(+)
MPWKTLDCCHSHVPPGELTSTNSKTLSASDVATSMEVRGPKVDRPAATTCRPETPTRRSPDHTPQLAPTAKLTSTLDELSRGSKATEKPLPPTGISKGSALDETVDTHPVSRRHSAITVSARMSIASCSSCWSVLKHIVESHDAVRILKDTSRVASNKPSSAFARVWSDMPASHALRVTLPCVAMRVESRQVAALAAPRRREDWRGRCDGTVKPSVRATALARTTARRKAQVVLRTR